MRKNDGKRNAYPESSFDAQMETTKSIVCSFSKLLEAEHRCHRRVGFKNSVSRFDLNLLTKIFELREELINESYKLRKGDTFEIYEPKHRIITTTRFRDRIPQASFVVNYMYPRIVSHHTAANCACVKNKGVDYARNMFKEYIRNSDYNTEYCVVSDFKSYFASINHKILFDELSKFFDERWSFQYFKQVINSNNQELGIDLGNEVNQITASSFFNTLDHIFENERYIRYMDDIRFIGSKAECKLALEIIEEEASRLGISLSKNKTYIQKISKPIKFLGFSYLLHPTQRITTKRLKTKLTREKRKLRRMKKLNVPMERIQVHYDTVRSVMKKGTRSSMIKLDTYFNNLFFKTEEKVNASYQ